MREPTPIRLLESNTVGSVVVELAVWSSGVARKVCDCDPVEVAELAWGMSRTDEPEAETDEEYTVTMRFWL